MDRNRKNIIIDEIHYWKSNHLLPEEYCNFLLALYTEGEASEEDYSPSSRTSSSIWQSLFVALIILLVPVSFLVIYFTNLHSLMQMGIITIFLCVAFACIFYYKNKTSIYIHAAYLVFFLILLLLTVYGASLLPFTFWLVQGMVVLNCALWIYIGYTKQLVYLKVSGIIGLTLWVANIFFNFSIV
ncbi:hypothetical protein [Pontibacillus litoralis]|uniref:DUF2157 domain-containing protein n=1 Tax=Pontibacillus litoralis JSM 072002 TaxID=1385512 RepID=A0A0A5G7S5_9BACI|nr:hypothetical protein [Pontibacillus litoralis]KGX89191.1 hypothetical protein N784_00780 [Pontibacillus litoralis JSM 072002]